MSTSLIGVDWGTSNLRAWAFDGQGRVLAQASNNAGVSTAADGQFADVSAYRRASAAGFGIDYSLYAPGRSITEVSQGASALVSAWRSCSRAHSSAPEQARHGA